jgi:ribosomal protein S18 acetylase RimI-like enzyme
MSENKLIIRDARNDELDEVAILLRDAYSQCEKSMPPGVWAYYVDDIMDVSSRLKDSELIVAELENKIVGSVTLYLRASATSKQGWPKGWAGVRLLGVHPLYRGHGIGKALMEEVILRCNKKNIQTVGLYTSKIMEVARIMYERMGFKRATEFDYRPASGVSVLAYRLDLKATKAASHH